MNLAVPTVLIIVGLIPGIAFLSSYYSGPFRRELVGLSPLGEAALFLFYAIFIDLIALHFLVGDISATNAALLTELWLHPHSSTSRALLETGLLDRWWLTAGLAYAATVVGSVVLGSLLRRVVWTFRLDLAIPMLRMRPDWFYSLQGRFRRRPRLVITEADILVSHPAEGTRLYAGVVESFSTNRAGELQDVTLVAAQRWRYHVPPTTVMTLPRPGGWHPIPGDKLVLLGATIHSLNLRYSDLQLPKGAPFRERIVWKVSGWYRSFILEER